MLEDTFSKSNLELDKTSHLRRDMTAMKDKLLEKKQGELVKMKLRELLLPHGFFRTKPSFYTRLYEDRIEFIHLHKLTSGPFYRVHTGIRFLLDDLDYVALNGIQANGYKNEYSIHYNFRYHKDEDSILRCANQILLFVENEAIPWFNIWRYEDVLYTRQDSPLRKELVYKYNMLKKENKENAEIIFKSKKLLGIKE
ncbi:hypothetical protein [Paenibacillus illinoisensis]|uniref:hypothetical protein n=1 Tax=Paenibacillus illinoisensis TaxID=59845 RepID=UPI001C8E203A|nr:hypothetical protein [Paenibacillus illinoisensis]MBY0215348.1 hypothetical protein [Paenibacillus illinoisensis]